MLVCSEYATVLIVVDGYQIRAYSEERLYALFTYLLLAKVRTVVNICCISDARISVKSTAANVLPFDENENSNISLEE
jgi:hypothetical protein